MLQIERTFRRLLGATISHDRQLTPYHKFVVRPCDLSVSHRALELKVIFCVRGVISPLLSNIVLHEVDRQWCLPNGTMNVSTQLVRYAEDMVLLARTAREARQARRPTLTGPARGASLHPQVGTKERPLGTNKGTTQSQEAIDDIINPLPARVCERMRR